MRSGVARGRQRVTVLRARIAGPARAATAPSRRTVLRTRVAGPVVLTLAAGLLSATAPSAAASDAPAPRYLAPAIDNSISVETVANAQTLTSATATISTSSPGDLLLAFVGSDSPPSGPGQTSVVTGGGLTWTLLGDDSRQLGDAEVWSARATGVLTDVKITATANLDCWDEALTVVAYRNSTGTGAIQTSDAPSGAPTGTLTTTQNNSWVWASGDDWLASIPRTPGPGQTVQHSATDKVGDTYWVQSTDAPTPASGTAVTIDDTAPTTDPYNYVLVEILGRQVFPPAVTAVSPDHGPASGLNTVLVSGTNLTGATEVDFGAAKVTSGISVAPDGGSLTVEAPPGAAGTVDVRVTTPVDRSPVVPADQYTYTAPPPTPYSGAHIALTPGSAGPNPPHTTQTLRATLTDHDGKPLPGLEVNFTISGANDESTAAPTDAQGVATLTYTGVNAGDDTVTAALNAGADSVTSAASTVSWVVPTAPVAPVSMDPVKGDFYAEPAGATTFIAKPGDTPTFGQTFPDIAFNPPAGIVAGDHYPPSPATRPFTDVTTDVDGNADGTIVAQGNGAQAGLGTLTAFDAALTTTLHVTQPGDLSYLIDSADGFLLGIGNGASRVNGDFINPPAGKLSVFGSYPLVAAADQPSGGTVGAHPVTIHFPTAGDYPVEFDYFSTGGPQDSLVFAPSAAVPSAPNTPPFNVYVGYQDTLRSSNDYTISPLPWYGSPNVLFKGDSSAQGPGADAGGVRFDNVTGAPVTIDKVTVDIPRPNGGAAQHYDQWPTAIVVQPGQTLILTENAGYASFDTSDIDSGTCGVVQQGLAPSINVTIGGVTSVYRDTGEVLNTGGFDLACIGNESEPWVRVGTTGPANPLLPPPRVGASGAWDPDTNAFLLYGGYDAADANTYLGDTWAWQKGKWTAIASTATPPARAYAGGAYDTATRSLVVFGGYNTQTGTNYNDTWTFDGNVWTQRHPAHSPPLLNQASDRMAYDDATGTVVLLTSGSLGTGASDTWTWDGTDWTEHAAATQPGPRWYPALGFDPDTGGLILFGGSHGYQGSDLADTWQWDGANWTQLSPAAAAPARAAATLDYVPSAHGLVLFGSDHGATDTWLYKGGTWSRLSTAAAPAGRGYAVSAYDPVDQTELIGFGGQGGSVSQPLGDLWYFAAGNWSTTLPAAAAPVLPPADSIAVSPGLGQSVPAGQAQSLTVCAIGANGQPLAGIPVQVRIIGPDAGTQTVTTDADGIATITVPGAVPGVDQIQASTTLSGVTLVSNQVTLTESAPPSGPPPAIGGSQPADGTVVRAPVPITATLTPPSGQSIASWSVTAQSSAPGSPPFTLASGSGAPPATLATLDPTALANGQYDVTVSATASGGGVQSQTTALSVAGPMKLGAYQATYHELTLPVGGLSMTVNRVYDSTDHATGDFGAGWRVDVADFQVATGRPLGKGGWQEYPQVCSFFGLSCSYNYVAANVAHTVTVTWPDGHQEVWNLTPKGSGFAGLKTISPVFTAKRGTNTIDTLTEDSDLAFGDDGNMYNSLFADVSDGTLYNPTRFTLTTRDGTVYELDTTHGLLSETSPSGDSISIDGNGVHGSNGQSITFVRDGAHNNRITSITGPDDGVNGQNQHWTYSYNSAGELASVTDPVTTVNYSYDPAGGQLLKSTDANNQPITTITYGPDGRVASIAHGDRPPTTVTTDAATRSQTITDPNGRLTTTQLYDADGDLAEQDQNVDGRTLKTTYAYDAAGRQTKITDPLGGTSTTVYDETAGSPTEGNTLSETDADGNTWHYGAYNKNGQPGETVNPDGSVAKTVVFDPASARPLSIDVPGLAPTTYTYNRGAVATITDPAGRRIGYTYDANGYRTGQADSAGDKVQYTNDAAGRPISETDQSGYETDYTYDGNGNVTSVTNEGTSASATATYNGFDKPTKITDADGHSTTYTYDASGRMLTRTDADGGTTGYGYNADGALTSETTPSGTTHYTYDPLGRMIEADNAARQLTFAYDDAGHLLTQTTCAQQAAGQPCPAGSPTVTDTVDAAGLVTSTTTPAGRTSYTYTPDESLATVTDASGGVFVYGYDAQGRQNALTRPNQTADQETFNDINQPLSLTSSGPGGATLAKGTNTLDPATGAITQMTDLAGANTYTYNADLTLASATHPSGTGLPDETYGYDPAGNRITGPTTSSVQTYDPANRLLSDGSATYTWNGEGELATRTVTATGVTTTYTWNADGLLLGTGDTSGSTVANTYDPFGRLATQTANGTTTVYLWDGQTLVSRTSGSTTTSMVTAPAAGDTYGGVPLGGPAATLEVDSGATKNWPLYNLHGDLTGATNAAGQLTGPIAEYSAFGSPSAGSGADALPFGFDGYLNTAGGLDYASGRYYDPSTGRFLTPDPLPATNPYAYSGNSPVSFTDPSGREDLAEEGIADSTAAELAAEGEANVSVYYAEDYAGKCYVGITNNFARRAAQHDGRFAVIEELEVNLTRGQARIVEQTVIEELGLGGQLGQAGQLLNKINSIAPGGPLWSLVGDLTVEFADIAAVLDAFSSCP